MSLAFEYAIVIFILGMVPIVEKSILQTIDADAYIVLAVISMATLCVGYICAGYHTRISGDLVKLNSNPRVYILIAFCALAVFIVENYIHLSLIRANKAYMVASIISCYPIVTAVLGYTFFNEKVSVSHVVGILMIVSGATVLTTMQ